MTWYSKFGWKENPFIDPIPDTFIFDEYNGTKKEKVPLRWKEDNDHENKGS